MLRIRSGGEDLGDMLSARMVTSARSWLNMAVDPALIGIVGALAGAIVGLVGSVAVQRAANVHARELWARQQRTNMLTNQRADLLKAIYEFVLAAERAQGMAGPDRSGGEQSEASAAAELLSLGDQELLPPTFSGDDGVVIHGFPVRPVCFRVVEQDENRQSMIKPILKGVLVQPEPPAVRVSVAEVARA